MKKLFSLLAALLLAAAGYAQSGTVSDNLTWELTADGTLTINGSGAMGNGSRPWYSYRSSIKSVVVAEGVTHIGVNAFSGCNSLTSVTIPNSVTAIGYYAFSECSSLSSVSIPSSVYSIGSYAFLRCSSLSSVSIPSGVTDIGTHAFSECSSLTAITVAAENPNYTSQDGVLFNKGKSTLIQYPTGKTGAYVIPGSVATIGDYAFGNCSGLASVTIPEGVTAIGERVFSGCSGLTSVTIPSSVATIGSNAFYYCDNLSSVTVAWTTPIAISSEVFYGVDANKVQLIVPQGTAAAYAAAAVWKFFYIEGMPLLQGGTTGDLSWELNLTSGTLTISGTGAMPDYTSWVNFNSAPWYSYRTSIKSAVVADGITSIGEYAFSDCTGLTTLSIPEGVTTIGRDAFVDCTNLTSVSIPGSVTTIGSSAFYDCYGLTSLTVGWTTPIAISSDVFPYINTNKVQLIVPQGTAATYAAAAVWKFFYIEGMPLLQGGATGDLSWELNLTSGALTISGSGVMPDYYNSPWYSYRSSIKSVVVAEGVTTIGSSAFSGCSSLSSVTIPDAVTSIGSSAFSGCTNLTSVTLPSSITAIGSSAFSGCSSLSSVTIPDAVTTIGSSAFANCTGITTLSIPEGVTSIVSSAFTGCSKLTAINVAAANGSYSSVDGILFSKDQDTLIKYPEGKQGGTLVIPASLTTIDGSALSSCTGITAISVADGNPSYSSADGVLFNKDKSTLIRYPIGKTGAYAIPTSVTAIGDYAFSDCVWLTAITIPEGVTTIGRYAFANCTALTNVIIPNSVTLLAPIPPIQNTFRGCTGLTSVTIGSGITRLGSLFTGCTSLSVVNIPANVTSIESAAAFSDCTGLTTINVAEGNPNYSSADGVLLSKDKLTLVKYPAGRQGAYAIPTGITAIGSGAFSGCVGLSSVTIPEGITSIGSGAFSGCVGLSSVTIPEGITSIGSGAFANCTKLATVNFNAVRCGDMSSGTFNGCTALATVNMGSKVTRIPDNLLYTYPDGLGITSIAIPEGVTYIGEYAFYECSSLVSVTIPSSMDTIGYGAFQSTDLASVTIPEGVTYIGGSTFSYSTKLTSVNFNAISCTYGSSSYGICNECTALTTLNIGSKVTRIPEYAFYKCAGLSELVIPESVTTIGNSAFYGCSKLASIASWNPVPPALGEQVFSVVEAATPLYVLPAGLTAYRQAEGWKEFLNVAGVYAVKVAASSSGAGSVTGDSVYLPGSTATVAATPREGYCFKGWQRGGVVVATANPLSFTVVRDTSLVAMFVAATAHTLTLSVCDSVRVNGTTYAASGVYEQHLTNAAGCDSVLTIELTVNHPTAYTLTQTVGGSLTVNGTTYTASGTYHQTLQNAAGCDSLLTIELTVAPAYTVTFYYSQGSSRITQQEVEKGGKATEPAAPTKSGYIFGGWYVEPECLNKWNFNTAITADLKLYAQWIPEGGNPTAVAAAELLPLTLYPTVTNGELKVENGEWGGAIASEAKQPQAIEVYNLSGALVAKVPTTGEITSINISQLPSGTYVVKVGRYAGKVVKR